MRRAETPLSRSATQEDQCVCGAARSNACVAPKILYVLARVHVPKAPCLRMCADRICGAGDRRASAFMKRGAGCLPSRWSWRLRRGRLAPLPSGAGASLPNLGNIGAVWVDVGFAEQFSPGVVIGIKLPIVSSHCESREGVRASPTGELNALLMPRHTSAPRSFM